MITESRIEKRDDEYFRVTSYFTSHTGTVSLKVEEGQRVEEGDVLYTITRLDLIKKRICEITEGTVRNVNMEIDNRFCGYFVHVMDLEHRLTPEEAQIHEEEAYYTFVYAPQGAQYYTTPNPGMPPLIGVGDIIDSGHVIAIAMVMKKRREITYEGKRGRVAKIYFLNGQQVAEKEKLFGIVLKPISIRKKRTDEKTD
jgi:biotin carboxyl carrier protein